MFAITYVMVAESNHFYITINKVYMTILMVAAMGIVNGLVMPMMYSTKILRYSILGSSILITGLLIWIIRTQTFVDDKSFLRSMIPHHSSAILMCDQSNISDEEIKELCDEIVQTQREEIQIMQIMLSEKE